MDTLDNEFIKPEVTSTDYTIAKHAIEGAQTKIKRARIILFALGLFTIIGQLYIWSKIELYNLTPSLIVGFILGVVYIVAGFSVKKFPILTLSISIVLYVGSYILAVIIDPSDYMINAGTLKLIVTILLGIGLQNAMKAKNIKKKFEIK